ncbi:trypsin-like serine protease [Basidiobolus meristosporus CBS 931.73]|uniref:Trypsin-like serine protease n=1 Tax=Basidiobolus meristosporus CBS 931.73 TaxID=1314790 RepID=A0A1Y1YSR8_9FUNG|nr:trypsin-like serine protease [Basidiobolus meristosporus CBS 931.73]|eukprot:ORY01070.1 trypsin-like serine protease [Basidiobolus meristosporus CBS 931.73]
MRNPIFLALSAACIPLTTNAIINGGFATNSFLRGVVKVNDDCTGALVGNKCVLTAHHCLAKNRLGEVMLPDFKDSVVVESTKKSEITSSFSPDYSDTRCYDMEIAVLSECHNMGYNLTSTAVKDNVAVAGWGFLNDYTLPKVLQFYQYPVQAKYSSEGITLPVADGVSGIAFRDSGGPLFNCDGNLCSVAGVVNGKTMGSTILKTEHVFCDVLSNSAWISETLKTHCY